MNNKTNKKNIRGNRVKKIKRGIIVGSVLLFGMTIFVNSSLFTGNQENVYSQMKEKYGFNVSQVVEAHDEETQTESQEQVVVETTAKNYVVTVDMDLRTPSNATAEDIEKMLAGTKLAGLGQAFVDAEKTYGVNALYMMGLAAEESGYGTSNYAVKRNNLYGWGAVDSNPDLAKHFETKYSATLFVASKLKQNYLTEGGAYHEGYSARSVDVHYCTDKQHADKIVSCINYLLRNGGF